MRMDGKVDGYVELADKTFNEDMKATIKSMRNEIRKNKIERLFQL